MWAVIEAGYASLEELETTWSLDDVERALAVIQIRAEAEADAMKRAAKGK